MSYPKPVPIYNIQFDADRHGFMCALSRRESTSNLLIPHSDPINKKAAWEKNSIGYVGYFQFGEDALIDCGYYNPRIKNSDKDSVNNWTGSWTGKDNINTFYDFRTSPNIQIKAFNIWIEIQCYRARNLNINEFYGTYIDKVEITESGCITAGHLKGSGHVLAYLKSGGRINGQDKYGTSVGDYIRELAYYDLESCCNRKIYIKVEKDGEPISDVEVNIESEYKEGKYYSKIGKIKNTYTTNDEGRVPVIVRHPGAVIKVTVNGKSSVITQKSDKKQNYTIDITGSIKATGILDKSDSPKQRPVPNKSPQDQRNEQNKQQQAQQTSSSEALKEVTFNLTIVEADTKKTITNLRYYLTYKGQSKEHRTDNQGIESNITAEVGQDIEVCVAGEGRLQAVAHFKVSDSHQGKTIRALLSVQVFNIEVKDHNKLPVKNTNFMIFYRGREIVKQTNSQGLISVKMLVGFVYKFGLTDGKPLVSLRCLKGVTHRTISINETAKNKATGLNNTKSSLSTNNNTSSSSKPVNKPPSTKPTIVKPKTTTEQSHTEKNGRPITTISTDKAASDTTRYHIYHNGKIKRENADATGYAEFIYYDEKGGKHNLGKSKYIPASKLKAGNVVIDGYVYLIDQRQHPSYLSPDKKLGYKWEIPEKIDGKIRRRYYLNGLTMAGVLGTLLKMGYQEYHGTGWSNVRGESIGSSSHRNGEAGDFRYLGRNNIHRTSHVWTNETAKFDRNENIRWVKTFKKFGFKTFYTSNKPDNKREAISGTSYWQGHFHHLHLGNQGSADSLKSRGILEDI